VRTEARLLLAVGVFVLAGAVVYWLVSDEESGTTMLALAGALGLMIGGYLLLEGRHLPDVGDVGGESEQGPAAALDEAYLPHASVWPFVAGVGAVLLANGLLLGLWAVVPGAIVLVVGLTGFARQSRHRD
jgi:hypothetical protein